MFPIKNDIKCSNIITTGSHKSFPIHCIPRGKYLKRFLTYVCCTKYNKVNIRHFDVQNHTSYTK